MKPKDLGSCKVMLVDVQEAILRSYKYPWFLDTTLKEDLDNLSRDKKAPPYPALLSFRQS